MNEKFLMQAKTLLEWLEENKTASLQEILDFCKNNGFTKHNEIAAILFVYCEKSGDKSRYLQFFAEIPFNVDFSTHWTYGLMLYVQKVLKEQAHCQEKTLFQ